LANRLLNEAERSLASGLIAEIRTKLDQLAGGDRELLFAYRRKVYKERIYDERSKPMHRRAIKQARWTLQEGLCAECKEPLPLPYSELDRKKAVDGYTIENTELVHDSCHRKRQADKNYS
jgi:hypothetical protein